MGQSAMDQWENPTIHIYSWRFLAGKIGFQLAPLITGGYPISKKEWFD
jgi:hypothetical protein